MVRRSLHGALLLILLLLPASPALCAACVAGQCPMPTSPAGCHDMASGHDMTGHGMAESGGPHAGHAPAAPPTCHDETGSAASTPDCCVSTATPAAEEQAVPAPVPVQVLAVAAATVGERCELPLRADGDAREGPLLRAPSPLYTLHSALLI